LHWVKSQVDSGLTVSRAVVAVRALEMDGRLFMAGEMETGSRSEPGPALIPPQRESLLDALTHHDLPRADQLLGEMLAFYSPEVLTLDVIGPALNAIGEAWEQERISVATEHLASNPVILACAPGEWHEGSLLMLGVLLRRQGWPVAYLGQNVPFHDLAEFMDTIHPPAVVLVAMCDEPARALAKWPQWITQVGGNPAIAFGGRAFVLQPELQGIVPGIYLGATIQDGLTNLVSLLHHA
jgi:methanogenic corrinoid protein MtbC1